MSATDTGCVCKIHGEKLLEEGGFQKNDEQIWLMRSKSELDTQRTNLKVPAKEHSSLPTITETVT